MARDFSDVYDAIREADKAGRTEDVAKLTAYLEAESAKPEPAAEEETYDPREKVDKLMPAAITGTTAAAAPPLIKAGIKAMEEGRVAPGGALSRAPVVPEGHTPFNPRGVSVEQSVGNWKTYNEAQLEAAKKVRQESALHKKYPGFTRAGTEPVRAPIAPNATAAERVIAKALPGGVSDVANFAKGIYDYKLPFVGSVGSMAGRGLVGAGSGLQFADAYNRGVEGDTTGAVISGIGGLGTAATLLPFLPAKVIGTGVGLSAEAINAYRDAMRKGRIEHTMPGDYGRMDAMGNAYAQGGLVHLAKGGDPDAPWNQKVVPNPEDLMGTFSYAPGYYGEVADRINPEGQSAGVNDALRHMLAAGDIARRVNAPIRASGLSSITPGGIPLVSENVGPAVARGLGMGHEMMNYLQNIGGKKPQTKEDLAQDLYNNALGAQLGGTATSFQDLINKMPAAINVRPYQKEKGKALIRHPDEVGTPYKPFKWF